MTIGSISNNLGLPPTIGQFIQDMYDGSGVASGTIAFAGGHMTLNAEDPFYTTLGATITNFGKNAGDEITIPAFNMTSESFTNGAMLIYGTSYPGSPTGPLTMHFSDLPSTGQFAFAQDGSTIDITWANSTPTPTPHPIPHPIHNPSPITGLPPGYHLS